MVQLFSTQLVPHSEQDDMEHHPLLRSGFDEEEINNEVLSQ